MKWISVKDKLPNEGGRYLCWVTEVTDLGISGFVWNCCYSENEGWSDNLKRMTITHWMPLPKPPKTN